MCTWLHAALTHLKTSASTHDHACCNTVQFKVNGTDPYGNGLFTDRDTAALTGYGALVCVEYGPESCLSML